MADLIDSFNNWRAEEGEPPMPAHWEVCDRCHGEGELRGYPGVYTSEDFREDPDFFDDYRAHRRHCEECGGRTTVRVADMDAADADTLDEWLSYVHEVATSYAIEAQERAMGA